jgi:hypothetical protein
MYKLLALFFLITMSLFMIGCEEASLETEHSNFSSSSQNYTKYQLTEDVYYHEEVTINYPQVIITDNSDLQGRVNDLIKGDVLYDFTNGVDEDLNLELDYDIQLNSPGLLSIRYSGVGYQKDASYPNNWYFTTNINMKTGEKVLLSDLVTIDEAFIELFKNAQYINTDNNNELQEAVNEYINNIDTHELIDALTHSDIRSAVENPSHVYSYMTEESLVISIGVPHALGDHAEFQIDLKDINDQME